jgi:hypothetical protein
VLLTFLTFVLLFPPLYNLVVPEQRGEPIALPMPAPGNYEVFVADWGYHTSIIVQQPPGWSLGPPGRERAAFLEYAWGDRMFYMESNFQPQTVFATLVLPTPTVMYLDGWTNTSSLRGARSVYARTMDASTTRALLLGLELEFRRSASTRLEPYPTVDAYDGRFYPSYGRYFWIRDCNWWTVARLSAAQLAGSAFGVIFSGQVSNRLHGFHRISSNSLIHADEQSR